MRGLVCVLGSAVLALVAVGQPVQAGDPSDRATALARQVTPKIIEWRRDFHAHPELSNREQRTSRVVAEHLRAIGVDDLKTGVARHGVVALIRGRKPGPTVALRADMDALPIREQTGLPFASQNEGVMHACGHDAHTAILLGAAQVLAQMRDELPGSVKLIFQPAEESSPAAEDGGASLMVRQGVLRDPQVSAIFALHVNPDIPTGKIGYRYGAIMAAVDHFRVAIKGKQSHAAMPWQGTDPIVASAYVIAALQTIVSRRVDARQPVVVSVGMIRAGTAWNIIPAEATFEGTVRTHNPEVRKRVAEEFRRVVVQTAAAHGATAEITYHDYGPAVWNDPALGKRMRPSLVRAVGEANLVEVEPMMGGEDFSHYAEKVPGFYVFLGVRNESIGAIHGVHTPQFVLDEAALPIGVRTLALLAIDYLRGESQKTGRPGG
jgi:amidohydrolase